MLLVSIRTANRGDVVLFCLNSTSDHYVVFHMGPTIHFLHSDCLPSMGLSIPSGDSVATDSSQDTSTTTTTTNSTPFALALGSGQRQPWAIGEITDKEYCQAKKTTNRFKVPIGTRFYRVKAIPWSTGS